MTNYKIIIEKPAAKFIRKQPADQQKRILKAISMLPEKGNIKQMKGEAGHFRLRVGDYRLIYRVEHDVLTVVIMDAGNRGQIYK